MIENLRALVPYNEFIGDLLNPDTHLVEVIEEWKPIIGYEGLYEISSFGRVKSFHRGNISLCYQQKNKKGYLKVTLCLNKIRKCVSVHRLVAIEFIKNPYNKPEVNHKKPKKTHNIYTNLEWATGDENIKHAKDNGLGCNRKLTDDQVENIRHEYTGIRGQKRRLSMKYGVDNHTIGDILNNKTYQLHSLKPITL